LLEKETKNDQENNQWIRCAATLCVQRTENGFTVKIDDMVIWSIEEEQMFSGTISSFEPCLGQKRVP